jgi:hypothetical protein
MRITNDLKEAWRSDHIMTAMWAGMMLVMVVYVLVYFNYIVF